MTTFEKRFRRFIMEEKASIEMIADTYNSIAANSEPEERWNKRLKY